MTAQREMFFQSDEADVMQFRQLLAGGGWLKRKHIMAALGWPERKVPAVAEAMGADIVRSRTHGFKLTELLTDEDIPVALHCADEILSQCRKNESYALAIRRKIHAQVA